MQVFLHEHFQKQAVEPGVGVPVDEPQIVARHVVAKIGELHALALAAAPPLAFHPPAKYLAANQLHPLELGEQLGTEQVGSAGLAAWRRGFGFRVQSFSLHLVPSSSLGTLAYGPGRNDENRGLGHTRT